MRMSDEDAAIEDWISSQAAVDNSIIEGTLFREEYGYSYPKRDVGSDESVDATPWEENLREASAKAIFTFITVTSIITLIVDPKMIVVMLPASVLAALLLSMAKRGGKKRRRVGEIKPGEDVW
jgi:hypothetical protein